MKRDMDLVRTILLKVEDMTEVETHQWFGVEGYDEATVSGHVELMVEAGLLDASVIHAMGRSALHSKVRKLTWEGHEFLDAVRSDTVWQKAKSTIADTVGTASLEIVKAVAVAVSTKALGL